MNKYIKDKITLNDKSYLYLRGDRVNPNYYLRIAKQPHWKDNKIISLKTTDKDKALKKAQKEYDQIMESDTLLKNRLFTKEDIEIATRNAGLGRIAEDKFKNLMLVKGYQVYIPVEDIWGVDFVLIKDGEIFTVQLKSSNMDKPNWRLENNAKLKYKDTCTHMAFVYIPEDRVWFVPTSILPDDVTGMIHWKMKNLCEDYEVKL
tara:strand:+ start:101 stop:712 length:612 start_codon:yes stop_codon:yes gene_type:complete